MEKTESVLLQKGPAKSSKDKSHIVMLVRRWGGATSDAVLDPGIQIFNLPILNGFIGYRQKGNCLVVFGDPICAPEDKLLLAKAFHGSAKKRNLNVIYIGASQSFADHAMQHICDGLIEFGNELILDPQHNPKKRTGHYGSLVRRKIKQAIREKITIHEYLEKDLELENEIERLGLLWLQSRKGMQIHISSVYLFDNRVGKRWFYAKQGSCIVGIVSLNQLQVQKGWLLNHLIVMPKAPNGVSELLVVSALEALEKENCSFATVGIIAAKELGKIVGINSFSVRLSKVIFKFARKIFDLNGLNSFWKKFHPSYKPTYLLFSNNQVNLRSIMNIFFALKGSLQRRKHE